MGFRINTNLSALRAQRLLSSNSEDLRGNFARLGSGRNLTADNASGLGRSERANAQIRSLTQVVHNTQSGIDFANHADDRLGEVSSSLSRLRELAVQGSNGTLSDADRATLQNEFDGLVEEIDAVATSEGVSGSLALDGSNTIEVQAGVDAESTVSSESVDVSSSSLGIDSVDLSDSGSSGEALSAIYDAIDSIGEARGELSSFSRSLSARQSSATRSHESLSSTASRFSSVDVALESASLIRNQLLSESTIASLLQANTQPSQALALLG